MQSRKWDWSDLGDIDVWRPCLGSTTTVLYYRLQRLCLRHVWSAQLGVESADRLEKRAGAEAGRLIYDCHLSEARDFGSLLRLLANLLALHGVATLRAEDVDEDGLRFVFTMAEDLDCSGTPATDEAKCRFDEGCLAGILGRFFGRSLDVEEIECWGKGQVACRFETRPSTSTVGVAIYGREPGDCTGPVEPARAPSAWTRTPQPAHLRWSDLGGFSLERPNLGPETSVAYYRLSLFALRDAMAEELGAAADRVLRQAGMLAGRLIWDRWQADTDGLGTLLGKLSRFHQDNMVGIMRVEESGDLESGLRLVVRESVDCAGTPPLGWMKCSFRRGLMEGIFGSFSGRPVQADPVACSGQEGGGCGWKVSL